MSDSPDLFAFFLMRNADLEKKFVKQCLKIQIISYSKNVARVKPRQDITQISRAFIPSADLGKLLEMLTSKCTRKNRGIIATESLPSTASIGTKKVIQDRQTRRPDGK